MFALFKLYVSVKFETNTFVDLDCWRRDQMRRLRPGLLSSGALPVQVPAGRRLQDRRPGPALISVPAREVLVAGEQRSQLRKGKGYTAWMAEWFGRWTDDRKITGSVPGPGSQTVV